MPQAQHGLTRTANFLLSGTELSIKLRHTATKQTSYPGLLGTGFRTVKYLILLEKLPETEIDRYPKRGNSLWRLEVDIVQLATDLQEMGDWNFPVEDQTWSSGGLCPQNNFCRQPVKKNEP